jgi:hypothetical protein
VYVQILSGRKIPLQLNPSDMVDDIREKIRAKEGVHPDQQVLFFNGISLDSSDFQSKTVHELFIRENATLFLTLRNRGG